MNDGLFTLVFLIVMFYNFGGNDYDLYDLIIRALGG